MEIRAVGIDLGKTTFHLVALGEGGKVLVRKKFTQRQLIVFTANMSTSLIGLEACSGAHFLGRALREQGHDVKLIPAQFVKPFVEVEQERLRRCGSHRGSGWSREHEVRSDQDRRPTRSAGDPSRSGPADRAPHSGLQSAACLPTRTRHYLLPRGQAKLRKGYRVSWKTPIRT